MMPWMLAVLSRPMVLKLDMTMGLPPPYRQKMMGRAGGGGLMRENRVGPTEGKQVLVDASNVASEARKQQLKQVWTSRVKSLISEPSFQ